MDGGVQKGLDYLALSGDVEGTSDGHPHPGAQDEVHQEACTWGVGLRASSQPHDQRQNEKAPSDQAGHGLQTLPIAANPPRHRIRIHIPASYVFHIIAPLFPVYHYTH